MSNTGVVLRKNANILKYLHKANPFIRDYIIRNSHKELVTCFQKIAINILHKKLKLSKRKARNLLKYRENLITLVNARKSLTLKRKSLQTGGFLSVLLSAVIPLLASLVSSAIKKRK